MLSWIKGQGVWVLPCDGQRSSHRAGPSGRSRASAGEWEFSYTTRVHLRQIWKLHGKTGEEILDSIKLCVEIHHVPSGKLPRISSKFAFSLQWGQTDGLVLCPPNSTEGISHFDSTVSCHRRHRCQPVPRLCLRALSMLCTQTDIFI